MAVAQKIKHASNPNQQQLLGRLRLRGLLARHDVAPDSEKSNTVLIWLEDTVVEWLEDHGESIDHAALLRLEPRLLAAIELGSHIYDAFTEEFSKFFYSPVGNDLSVGVKAVRKQLKRTFPGYGKGSLDRMTEAVICIISDRRLHLLEHVYKVFQESLFAEKQFDQKKLPGFFYRVTEIEHYNVPPDVRICQTADDLDATVAADDDESSNFTTVSSASHVGLLKEFWSHTNGFGREELEEGMVSVGLGAYIGVPKVARRAREFSALRTAIIEVKAERLVRNISRKLERRERLQEKLWNTTNQHELGEIHNQLSRVEDELTRLKERLAELRELLQPKPREVAKIFGEPIETIRKARKDRIDREIKILKKRIDNGISDPQSGWGPQLPVKLNQLIVSVTSHISDQPKSPKAHNLSEGERKARKSECGVWDQRGKKLTDRVSERIKAMLRGEEKFSPPSLHGAILVWLVDVENYFQFGLTGKGILAGLGCRQEWRLDDLLRF